ncbi:MAG: Abi family protein [Malacoplasma sp.]|nr:Abi family protein [Malacoplasma sp.]
MLNDIVNKKRIIKDLEANGLVIDDKKKLEAALFAYNYNTVIGGYSDIFYESENSKRYDKFATSGQILELYDFDTNLGNHLLHYVLKIEKKLNTCVAYQIINQYHLKDKCLLKEDWEFIRRRIFPNLYKVQPPLTYDALIRVLLKYLDTNEYTRERRHKHESNLMRKWKDVPLDLMCLTWSFSTTYNVFLSLDRTIIQNIVNDFGVPNNNIDGFDEFIKDIIHVRNLITHNYVMFKAEIKYQSEALKKLYFDITGKTVNIVTIAQIIELIQYFTNTKTLVPNTIKSFENLQILPKFKSKIRAVVTLINARKVLKDEDVKFEDLI